MSAEIVTKEDLQIFRIQLLDDLKRLISGIEKPQEEQEWVKSRVIKKMLDVSPGTLQNLRINGKIHPVKIEGSWRYNVTEIKALFERKEARF